MKWSYHVKLWIVTSYVIFSISLLSGANNGNIFIHDLFNLTGAQHHVASVVAKLDR